MTSLEDTIIQLDGLEDIADFFDDDELTKILMNIIKIMKSPDEVTPIIANKLIIQLSAFAVKAKLEAKIYMHFKKDERDARLKKDFLFTIHECFNDLANALKYSAK